MQNLTLTVLDKRLLALVVAVYPVVQQSNHGMPALSLAVVVVSMGPPSHYRENVLPAPCLRWAIYRTSHHSTLSAKLPQLRCNKGRQKPPANEQHLCDLGRGLFDSE